MALGALSSGLNSSMLLLLTMVEWGRGLLGTAGDGPLTLPLIRSLHCCRCGKVDIVTHFKFPMCILSSYLQSHYDLPVLLSVLCIKGTRKIINLHDNLIF